MGHLSQNCCLGAYDLAMRLTTTQRFLLVPLSLVLPLAFLAAPVQAATISYHAPLTKSTTKAASSYGNGLSANSCLNKHVKSAAKQFARSKTLSTTLRNGLRAKAKTCGFAKSVISSSRKKTGSKVVSGLPSVTKKALKSREYPKLSVAAYANGTSRFTVVLVAGKTTAPTGPTPTPVPTPEPTPDPEPPVPETTIKARAIARELAPLLDEWKTRHGGVNLTESSCLTRAAQHWANYRASDAKSWSSYGHSGQVARRDCGRYRVQIPYCDGSGTYTHPWDDYVVASEIIAWHPGTGTAAQTAQAMVTKMAEDPDSAMGRSIRNQRDRQVGIGVAYNENLDDYFAVIQFLAPPIIADCFEPAEG